MKKKTVVLLLCMAMAMSFGCGSKNNNNAAESTEAVAETEEVNATTAATSFVSTDIEYDVNDYVKLGDYKNVEVTLNSADYVVDDAAINDYADQLITYYAPYVVDETKTVVEQGDVVNVNYVGKKDGVAFDGGSAEDQLIDTASNTNATSQSGYIEGFSDGLVGAKVGDTIDSEVTFPEDYQSEELKGQTVTFTFTVNSIQKKVTREGLDDAFVSENFQVANVDEFYSNIRTTLEQQAETTRESDLRNAIIEKVTADSTVEFPEGLLEARVEEYIDGFQGQYCTDGTSLEDFLQANYGMTEEQFRTQTNEYLQETLTQELVFEAVAKAENIEFNQEEYDQYVSSLVSSGGFESTDALYEVYGPTKESGEKYLKKIYLCNKASTSVSDMAKVTYTEETATEETEVPEESTEQ